MNVLGILGSPSAVSRSASLLQLAQAHLQPVAGSCTILALRSLPAGPLLIGDVGDPVLGEAVASVEAADVVIVATPIYKAAYSGLLKLFLDLLPADALRGKAVLPLASGGTMAHLLALEYTLKPVLAALGARHVLDAVYACDAQLPRHEALGYLPDAEIQQRIALSLQTLVERAEPQRERADAARQSRELLARAHAAAPSEEAS